MKVFSIRSLQFTFTLFAFFSITFLNAQNARISVQGVLQKANGQAVPDGFQDLIFKLYDASSGGNTVHEETINTQVFGGVYSVILGNGGTPLNAGFNLPYYLTVTIASEELMPRVRLTAAPYALSLLGASNVFPSSGNVGVGVSIPNSKLAVAGGASIGSGYTGNTAPSEGAIIQGSVGIGTNNPTQAKLVVNGSANSTLGLFGRFRQPLSGLDGVPTNAVGGGTNPYSIYAFSNIAASEFHAFSDARIKQIVGRSNNAEDLRTLSQINITDYTYIDVLAKGNRTNKKVIAQELEAVYPTAVSRITDVVPDIYKHAEIKSGRVTLPNTLQPGERVRLILADKTETVEVLRADAEGFQVNLNTDGEVFVYGREVNDFRVVDYEALTTLNISATQELLKIINDQKTVNDRQQEQLAELQRQVAGLTNLFHGLAKQNEQSSTGKTPVAQGDK